MTPNCRHILGILLLALVAVDCRSSQGQDTPLAKKIDDAIDKGVAYVKGFTVSGATELKRPATWALRGWVLLEAGLPANDEDVKKLAFYIRRETPEMDLVYDLALSLIFLDKLADPGDEPLIESLAVRLLKGQANEGGWYYIVGKLHPAEKARLTKLILASERARDQGLPIKPAVRSSLKIIQDVAWQLQAVSIIDANMVADNSNTQFAMLALWVARRHGVPVSNSLQLVQKRFQLSQQFSGHWGYRLQDPPDDTNYPYPAMTCAGLLGLALGEGVRPKPRDLLKDSQVLRGLDRVAHALREPPKKSFNLQYFLFSMERALVVYNLQKIGDIDWYLWGADKLVASQEKDGSWMVSYRYEAVDTCFALLFLKRANVAQDLADILRGTPLQAPIRRGPEIRQNDNTRKSASDP